MGEAIQIDFVIVGAGVLGLSIVAALAQKFPKRAVALLEKHPRFGVETSSRNSEVIHAGIYYPKKSLKAKYCLHGRELLYDFCKKYEIPYKKCGKYIVTLNEEQEEKLISIRENALENGVKLNYVAHSELKKTKNLSQFQSALWSSETGIIDSHSYMKALEYIGKENDVLMAYKNSFVRVLDLNRDGILLEACDEFGGFYRINCQYFINAAGLYSAKIANLFLSNEIYKIKPCRGRYFSLGTKFNNYFENLIYPLPDPNGGLGVHITFELDGRMKLGPDVDWSYADTIDASDHYLYQFFEKDDSAKNEFYNAGKKIIPELSFQDISQNYIGIRPKLFMNGLLKEDFCIKKIKENNSLSVHYLGIESPGLTAALAMASDLVSYLN